MSKLPFLILVAFVLGSGSWLMSQQLSGVVMNAETFEPLPGANIVLKETRTGTLSNDKGEFSLECPDTRVTLRVTFVGFFPYEAKINPQEKGPILIRMNPKAVEIGEVLITAEKIERVYPDPLTHIHNYEFAGDNLALLIQEPGAKEASLILFSPDDSILARSKGYEPIGELFRDCFGAVHALGKNYACQLLDPDHSLAMARDSLLTFERLVKPVQGHLDSCLYYEQPIGPHQTLFFRISPRGKRKELLYATEDAQKLRWIEDDRLMASKNVPLYGWMGDPLRARTQQVSYEIYVNKIAFAPNFVPLRIIGDEVVIFDHANSKIVRFDNAGKAIGEAKISYHKERYWKKSILVDEERAEAFTFFRKNGQTIIREIDFRSGKLTNQWTLPKQFVQKLRIRNGVAWFIYKDDMYDDTKRLYKMDLK